MPRIRFSFAGTEPDQALRTPFVGLDRRDPLLRPEAGYKIPLIEPGAAFEIWFIGPDAGRHGPPLSEPDKGWRLPFSGPDASRKPGPGEFGWYRP